MNHLAIGTANLLNKLGDELIITTNYVVEYKALPGDDNITLKSSKGLVLGCTLLIGNEEHRVVEIADNKILIDPPLSNIVHSNTALVNRSSVKGLPVPRFKSITYDLLEFVRKIRVPQNTVVDYGSIVHYLGENFFVVGIDPGDYSYSLTMREINAYIDLHRVKFDLQDIILAESIPANITHYQSDLPLKEGIGYTPMSSLNCMIPKYHPLDPIRSILSDIQYRDIVIADGVRYSIVGFNRVTNKNFLNLILAYEPSR